MHFLNLILSFCLFALAYSQSPVGSSGSGDSGSGNSGSSDSGTGDSGGSGALSSIEASGETSNSVFIYAILAVLIPKLSSSIYFYHDVIHHVLLNNDFLDGFDDEPFGHGSIGCKWKGDS